MRRSPAPPRPPFPVLLLALLLCLSALPVKAEPARFLAVPSLLRPGKYYTITVQAPAETRATLCLVDASDATAAALYTDYPLRAGENTLGWDVMLPGEIPVAAGNYTLRLTVDGGETAEAAVRVGAPYPLLTAVTHGDDTLSEGGTLALSFIASEEGILRAELKSEADDALSPLSQTPVQAGPSVYTWDGLLNGQPVPDGSYAIVLTLDVGNGIESMAHHVLFEVARQAQATPEPVFFAEAAIAEPTPTPTLSPEPLPTPPPPNAPYSAQARPGSFWALTPGETDDAKIWEALTQPITVYDGGLAAAAKTHAYLMENPDGTGNMVAQLHAQSQGLNVLGEENEYGYILVEAFSNYDQSYNPQTDEEKARAFVPKQGYVRADALKTVEVNQEYGILVDKLSQRLYIYHNGERMTELLVATGLIQDEKYYCETIPGEYITISRTGGFWSGNMYCDMAIRINGGILLHEVPCKVRADGSHDYSSFEGYLGTKQSHGCIRIQRLKNDQGYNEKWIWNNIPLKTRVIIWDDLNRTDSPQTWYPNP